MGYDQYGLGSDGTRSMWDRNNMGQEQYVTGTIWGWINIELISSHGTDLPWDMYCT